MTVLFSNKRLIVRRSTQYSCRSLVVAFDPYTDNRRLDRTAFGERFAERYKLDMVFVLSRENEWYQYEELEEALAPVAELSGAYDRVISYGSSMGGYAAIRFGRWAGARTAAALSPQYSINPAVCPWENRWGMESTNIEFVLESSAAANGSVRDAFIFFDPHDPDARHVELFRSICCVHPIRLPWCGHPCGGFLSELKLLSDAILNIAHDAFDPTSFERRCRQKRNQSSQYLLTLASHLKPHHKRTRRQLAELAARVNPEDPGNHSLCGQLLSALGDFGDAEVCHRRALQAEPGHPAFLCRYSDHFQMSGRIYDAVTAMSRLNFTHPIQTYSQKYSTLYWQCFREAEQVGMTHDKVEVAVATTPSPPQSVTAWRRHLMQIDALSKARSDYYLIGDSHAEYWPQEFLPVGTFNLGNGGDKTQSVLWRLDEIERRRLLQPRSCIVIVGTNNLGMGDSPESIVSGVRAIEAKLRLTIGKKTILFVAIPPCGESGLFRNEERMKANALMERVVRTVDFEQAIRALGDAAFMPDSIHLTARAYRDMAVNVDLLDGGTRSYGRKLVMYLPWPIRPMLEYSRRKRTLLSALKEVGTCSGAMGPVKSAVARAVRGPPINERRELTAIQQRWIALSKRTDFIRVVGDSVPPHMVVRTVPVGEHTTNTSTTRPEGDLLFQLIRVIQPKAALELGTCVGLSGSYIASAMKLNNKGHLWTLEGMPDSVKVAEETFATLGLSDRVTPIVGRFADTLDTAVKNGPFGFAFIDGHHDGDATIEYFNKIKPSLTGNSVLVFDDIDWSRGMQSAWKHITQDKDIRDSAAVMGWGIVAL